MEETYKIISLKKDYRCKGILTATELLTPLEIPKSDKLDYYTQRKFLLDTIRKAFPEYFSEDTIAKNYDNSCLSAFPEIGPSLEIEQLLHQGEKNNKKDEGPKIKYQARVILPKQSPGLIKIYDTTLSLDLNWILPKEWQSGNYFLQNTHILSSTKGMHSHDYRLKCSTTSEYDTQIKKPNKLHEALELSLLALVMEERLSSLELHPGTSTRFDFSEYRPQLWNFTNPSQECLSRLTQEILTLKRTAFDKEKHSVEFYNLATNLAASLQLLEVYCKQYQDNLPKDDAKRVEREYQKQIRYINKSGSEPISTDIKSMIRSCVIRGIQKEKVEEFVFIPGEHISRAREIYTANDGIIKTSAFIYEAVLEQLSKYDSAMSSFKERVALDLPVLREVMTRREIL